MKLQHKAWILVVSVVLLCAAASVVGAQWLVRTTFSEIDALRVQREALRLTKAVDQQLQELGVSARDYGYWNEAVDFVKGQRPSFMSEYFDAESMGNLRISAAMVFDASGHLIASVETHGDGQLQPMPGDAVENLRGFLGSGESGLALSRGLRTLRAQEGRLELLAVEAVRSPDDKTQKHHGFIVMARPLDSKEQAKLSDLLLLPLRLSFSGVAAGGKDVYLQPIDDHKDALHVVLRDHHGLPVSELVAHLDREFHLAGNSLANRSVALAAGVALVAGLLLVLLLDRLVLRRLQTLSCELQSIYAMCEDNGRRVSEQGRDELSQLAMTINRLLGRVRSDAQQKRLFNEVRHDAQRQKIEALERLTGAFAHGFNNALAAISGWLKLAREDVGDVHPATVSVEQAQQATLRAGQLVRQVMAAGGHSAMQRRRLRLGELVDTTVNAFSSDQRRDCLISVHQTASDDEIEGDPVQLQLALSHLLSNAVDAMDGKGPIELTLDALELPATGDQMTLPAASDLVPGRYLVLCVLDHGKGVPAENLHRVFDPFFSTKGRGRESGLGLSVAQGIVLRHHGGIGMDNRAEGGVRCCILLPVHSVESRQPADAPPASALIGPAGLGQGRRVLFVDDDQLVRHAWSALLERQGWLVTQALDGEDGWGRLASATGGFDLVITDQAMPRLDGVGLARRIRQARGSVPIVLLSGHVNEVGSQEQKTLFNAVLRKPVDADVLSRTMDEVLGRARQVA